MENALVNGTGNGQFKMHEREWHGSRHKENNPQSSPGDYPEQGVIAELRRKSGVSCFTFPVYAWGEGAQ